MFPAVLFLPRLPGGTAFGRWPLGFSPSVDGIRAQPPVTKSLPEISSGFGSGLAKSFWRIIYSRLVHIAIHELHTRESDIHGHHTHCC